MMPPGPPQVWTAVQPSAPGAYLMAPAAHRDHPVMVYVREVGDTPETRTLRIHGEGLSDRAVDDLPPAHLYMGTIPRESKPAEAGEATGRATLTRGAWSALAEEPVERDLDLSQPPGTILTVGPNLHG